MEMRQNQSAVIESIDIKKDFTYNSVVMLSADLSAPQITLKNNRRVQNTINRYNRIFLMKYYRYAANTLYKNAIENYRESVKNGFPFHEFAAVLKYNVTLNDNCHLSLYSDFYEYTGGAHGMTYRTPQSWNLNNGKLLKMSDLFPRGENYRKNVLDRILAIADEQMAQDGIYFEDYRKLIVENFNEDNFYLDANNLIVYYGLYEIAPYAAGIIEFKIPYSFVNAKKPSCD